MNQPYLESTLGQGGIKFSLSSQILLFLALVRGTVEAASDSQQRGIRNPGQG
ncbi:unknown protein [Microcystis aeruginosa NIES-843]|uniref:Uncharacterized protein n=2 Tax=Microcystis TaxID=1125 RepID=B0JSC3_MICAN|nr:hypothetical protein VL20_2745 [Microcystis panniformis FACHB-1757]BAG04081.1 unknown protein [Microcystis aeruginosa NIES-843]